MIEDEYKIQDWIRIYRNEKDQEQKKVIAQFLKDIIDDSIEVLEKKQFKLSKLLYGLARQSITNVVEYGKLFYSRKTWI